jgi:hypothetical protein
VRTSALTLLNAVSTVSTTAVNMPTRVSVTRHKQEQAWQSWSTVCWACLGGHGGDEATTKARTKGQSAVPALKQEALYHRR